MAVLSKVANIAVQPQPVGVVEAFAGSNAPNGWLICDGSQVSRALFPELFSVIGTTYGSGDGFSTFTLPDLRGRTIAGRDGVNNMNNGPTNRLTSTHFGASGTALGNSGGVESHTLTTAQLPAHAHDVRSNIFGTENSVPVGDGRAQPSTTAGWTWSVAGNAGANHLYTKNTGSGAAHNITQPTMILNYIIKAVSELPRGGWYNSSSPDLVTSLPTNPYEGQEVYLQQTVAGTTYQTAKRYSNGIWYDTGATPAGTWINATYQNSWTTYGQEYGPARYMKDANNTVYISGLVRGGVNGNTIFTLPTGYRPLYREIFTQSCSPNAYCRVDVLTNGNIIPQNGNTTDWVSIAGISYKAET